MKHAIIMGASSGTGCEVAKLLLNDGWKVGLAARRTEPMEEICKAYPDSVTVMRIDVTADDAPERLMQLIETMGGVQLYLHASGIGKKNLLLEPTVEARTVATNVAGFTRMIDTVFGYMATNGGGHIAVISSIAGPKGGRSGAVVQRFEGLSKHLHSGFGAAFEQSKTWYIVYRHTSRLC